MFGRNRFFFFTFIFPSFCHFFGISPSSALPLLRRFRSFGAPAPSALSLPLLWRSRFFSLPLLFNPASFRYRFFSLPHFFAPASFRFAFYSLPLLFALPSFLSRFFSLRFLFTPATLRSRFFALLLFYVNEILRESWLKADNESTLNHRIFLGPWEYQPTRAIDGIPSSFSKGSN